MKERRYRAQEEAEGKEKKCHRKREKKRKWYRKKRLHNLVKIFDRWDLEKNDEQWN